MSELSDLLNLEDQAPSEKDTQRAEDLAANDAEYGKWQDRSGLARGVMRGALGPVPDLVDRATMSDDQIEDKRINMEEQAGSVAVGEMVGLAGGAVTGTGLGGLLTKGGAKLAGKLGGGSMAKLAAGAAEGATIGLSEGTSLAAIDNRLGGTGVGAMLAENVGTGIAMGGVASLAGIGLSKTSGWLFKKGYGKHLQQVSKSKGEHLNANRQYNSLISTLESLEQSGQRGGAQWQQIVGNLPARGKGASRKVGDYTVTMVGQNGSGVGAKKSLLWKAANKLESRDQAVRSAVDASLEEAGKQAAKGIDKASTAATVVGSVLAGNPLTAVAARMVMPGVSGAISQFVVRGIHGLKPVRKLVGRSLKAGRLTYDQTLIEGGKYIAKSDPAAIAAGRLFKLLKVPPIQLMTNMEYRDAVSEINESDPAEYELQVRGALSSKGVPQEVANPQVDAHMRTLEYLKNAAPPVNDNRWVAEDDYVPVVSQQQRLRFSRRTRAALAPMSVIKDFLDGKLTHEAAQTWWAVFPDIAAEFAKITQENMEIALAHGKKFTPSEKRNLALFTDPKAKRLGRTRDINMVRFLQGNYANERAENQPPQPGGPKTGSAKMAGFDGVNDGYLTTSQQTQKNLMS